jgi:peroxin-2
MVPGLVAGWCRSLLERLLSARLVYQQPNMARIISFEYLNRQLVGSTAGHCVEP